MKFASERWASCLAVTFALFLSAGAADAISITNRDDKEQKLTVIEGEAKKDYALAAAGVLENICMSGCVVRLNDSENDEYELEGTEVVSIEDGYLYYDGPETPADQMPAPPVQGQPTTPPGTTAPAPKQP